jgi:hypothetical protein
VLLENGELTPAEPSVTEFVRREYFRYPLALLKAWQRGDAIAFARSPAQSGAPAVERVVMHAGGATTTLGLDPVTGRVVEVSYRGRITRGISDAVLRFADFREVHGIVVPFHIEHWADGALLTQPRVEIESVEILARDYEVDQLRLAHELDVTALTSLALALLDNGEVERAKAMLQARLAEAVRAADELTAAGTTLATTAPNLLAALGRAAEQAATRDPATAEAARRTRLRLQAGDDRTPPGKP